MALSVAALSTVLLMARRSSRSDIAGGCLVGRSDGDMLAKRAMLICCRTSGDGEMLYDGHFSDNDNRRHGGADAALDHPG